MTMQIEKAAYGSDWLVVINDYEVKFRCMEDALAFAHRLKERLDAPHALPAQE
ncbi:MAG TPA: hypothetical protein VF682_05175 [Pseudomonas sp.]|jgi:hypothetical protein